MSFTENINIDTREIGWDDLRTIWMPGAATRYTLEGKMVFFENSKGIASSYIQLFRNGIIEAVETSALMEKLQPPFEERDGFATWQAHAIKSTVESTLKLYQKLSIPTPIFGALSFTGVRGFVMYRPPSHGGISDSIPLTRDLLILPEFQIEDLNATVESVIEPIFDLWWQACGLSQYPRASQN